MSLTSKVVWWLFFYAVLFLIASLVVCSPVGIIRHPERMSDMESLVGGFCEFILPGLIAFYMVSKGRAGIFKRAGYSVTILIVLVVVGFTFLK